MRLLHGDCLELMATLPDASVDMILCDLPYGTTACKWDAVIPFEPLWAQYRRVAKANAAIVLTAAQPFTSALVMSNPRWFRYDWIWCKNMPTGFANAKRRPMRAHEDILVFCGGKPPYNPIMEETISELVKGFAKRGTQRNQHPSDSPHSFGLMSEFRRSEYTSKVHPKTTQRFDCVPRKAGTLHPTQKPVALMEYMIRTYTNEGDTVLDNCMGSGTTGVACVNTARRFIGIERDEGYFAIASARIAAAQPSLLPQDSE